MTNEKIERISTGSYDLNKWLYGGYETDVVTMIAGPPGSGKTNMCILVACSQARKGNNIIFFDTEGGFSVDRVKQIVGENYEDILKRIFLFEPTNFEEQTKSFLQLLTMVKKENINLIIIDSMVNLYRLELGELRGNEKKIRELNWKISKQMRILSEISRKHKIPIVITNQVYSDFLSEDDLEKGVKRKSNLVGGDILKYWSKCIIELQIENRKRKAILLKHRSLPFKELNFEIGNRGIFRRGFI